MEKTSSSDNGSSQGNFGEFLEDSRFQTLVIGAASGFAVPSKFASTSIGLQPPSVPMTTKKPTTPTPPKTSQPKPAKAMPKAAAKSNGQSTPSSGTVPKAKNPPPSTAPKKPTSGGPQKAPSVPKGPKSAAAAVKTPAAKPSAPKAPAPSPSGGAPQVLASMGAAAHSGVASGVIAYGIDKAKRNMSNEASGVLDGVLRVAGAASTIYTGLAVATAACPPLALGCVLLGGLASHGAFQLCNKIEQMFTAPKAPSPPPEPQPQEGQEGSEKTEERHDELTQEDSPESPEESTNVHQGGGFAHVDVCAVCLTRPANVVLIPCGHLCLCSDCALAVHDEARGKGENSALCPSCRKTAERMIVLRMGREEGCSEFCVNLGTCVNGHTRTRFALNAQTNQHRPCCECVQESSPIFGLDLQR